jgi:protein TonB
MLLGMAGPGGLSAAGLGNGPPLLELSIVAPPAPPKPAALAGEPAPRRDPAEAPAPPSKASTRASADPVARAVAPEDETASSDSAEAPTLGVVAAEPSPEEMLDFTLPGTLDGASSFVGRARGGAAPSGTAGVRGKQGGGSDGVAGGRSGGGGGDLTRSVRLPARNWRCPWPRQADALGIDEQTVVLSVAVDARGRVTAAELVRDPGHGFGTAALGCARQARFEPALGRDGQPVAAQSPPIRVRFTR